MKKPRISRRPAAIEDLVAQGEYYVEQGSPDTAVRFLEAVDTFPWRISAILSVRFCGSEGQLNRPGFSGDLVS